jgi:hypothetical protein
VSRDADMAIISKLAYINDASGDFTQGVLCDSLTPGEQIDFALQLVRLAEAIKVRAEGCNTGEQGALIIDGTASTEC